MKPTVELCPKLLGEPTRAVTVAEPGRRDPLPAYADAVSRIKRLSDLRIGTASATERLREISEGLADLDQQQRG